MEQLAWNAEGSLRSVKNNTILPVNLFIPSSVILVLLRDNCVNLKNKYKYH